MKHWLSPQVKTFPVAGYFANTAVSLVIVWKIFNEQGGKYKKKPNKTTLKICCVIGQDA